jgi:uncharacterized protein (TIGR03084 family)
MHEIVTALTEQQAELAGLLDGRDDIDWRRPSRCDGWNVADVVLHLAQTDELAIASLRGTFDRPFEEFAATDASATSSIDAAADWSVARERDITVPALHQRWRDSAAALAALLAEADPHARVQWVAGRLSARTLATTRLAETWIHTGDVADAFGVASQPTNRLRHVARLAWRTLPYAFSLAGRQLSGPVTFGLTGPDGEPWRFEEPDAVTTIRGDGIELCMVAARRVAPAATGLRGTGPDAEAVLDLVRTYA